MLDWVGSSRSAWHCCPVAPCHMCGGCLCAFTWCALILQSRWKRKIRKRTISLPPCENSIDATPASQLPLWLTSCAPPVKQHSFCLWSFFALLSPSFLFTFISPVSPLSPSSSLPQSGFPRTARLPPRRCYSKIKEQREEGVEASLSVSCLRALLCDISGKSKPTINSPNIGQSNPGGT